MTIAFNTLPRETLEVLLKAPQFAEHSPAILAALTALGGSKTGPEAAPAVPPAPPKAAPVPAGLTKGVVPAAAPVQNPWQVVQSFTVPNCRVKLELLASGCINVNIPPNFKTGKGIGNAPCWKESLEALQLVISQVLQTGKVKSYAETH